MANPQRGEAHIDINGDTYTLALDLNALCELQEALNPRDPDSVELDGLMKQLGKMNPRYVRAFVWATLRRHHPEITLKGASDLVTEAGGIATFIEQMGTLLQSTQPDARDRGAVKATGTDRPLDAPVDGTGTRSTFKRAKSG